MVRTFPSPDLPAGLSCALPLRILVAQRSLCRLRLDYLCLGHVGGQRSQAGVQSCIFCNKRMRMGALHVLLRCPSFQVQRNVLAQDMPVPNWDEHYNFMAQLLALVPGHPAYPALAVLCAAIDDQ
eukprot:3371390-Karenia_brevis.AAC.1